MGASRRKDWFCNCALGCVNENVREEARGSATYGEHLQITVTTDSDFSACHMQIYNLILRQSAARGKEKDENKVKPTPPTHEKSANVAVYIRTNGRPTSHLAQLDVQRTLDAKQAVLEPLLQPAELTRDEDLYASGLVCQCLDIDHS